MSSLYLHIPFCLKKCHYCSFASQVATVQDQEVYLSAIKKELISIVNRTGPLGTIFIGGGTPTSLAPESLAGLITFIIEHFEITQEDMDSMW